MALVVQGSFDPMVYDGELEGPPKCWHPGELPHMELEARALGPTPEVEPCTDYQNQHLHKLPLKLLYRVL